MTSGFAQTARVVSGTVPPARPVRPLHVTAGDGRLRLLRADSGGVVLDVPLERIRVTALDDAASVRVDLGDAALLVTFGRARTTGRAGGLADDLRARRSRRAFLAACEAGR